MCVFCDIVNKKIPSRVVYEDQEVLAILDISQTTKGHTLVMPKKHYQNILEIPDQELTQIIKVTKDLAAKIMVKLNAAGFNILANTNPQAGQSVMHLHFHIIPRYDENDGIEIKFSENDFDLDAILKEIIA